MSVVPNWTVAICILVNEIWGNFIFSPDQQLIHNPSYIDLSRLFKMRPSKVSAYANIECITVVCITQYKHTCPSTSCMLVTHWNKKYGIIWTSSTYTCKHHVKQIMLFEPVNKMPIVISRDSTSDTRNTNLSCSSPSLKEDITPSADSSSKNTSCMVNNIVYNTISGINTSSLYCPKRWKDKKNKILTSSSLSVIPTPCKNKWIMINRLFKVPTVCKTHLPHRHLHCQTFRI
mgnify:CR=1 FL=1